MKILTSYVQELDTGERYGAGEDSIDIEDTIFDPESPTLTGDIYRFSQREYGRCIGKVYVDYLHDATKYGPYPVGWVFVKRQKFEDDPTQSYLLETWVSLANKDETKRVIEYHKI